MSSTDKPAIIVTGISGNLGLRLLPMLAGFNVIGVDLVPPLTDHPLRYEHVDLGREAACRQLVQIIKRYNVQKVVHLAFVLDPLRAGVLEVDRMWQINVAGTARVMEAITEVNRHDGAVNTFLFTSSVSAYGPDTPGPIKETHPLNANTLPYAVQKMEADNVVRVRAETMGDCEAWVLRPVIFTGASVQNYMVGALRGTPTGRGKRAERMRQQGKRLPLITPGKSYRQNRFQFIHIDDVARLIAYILRQPAAGKFRLTVLNVAGRGEPITFEETSAIANARVMQVPGKWMMREILSLLWKFGVSGIPPEAAPYMYGSYLVDTTRLKQFLGKDYESVIQYSVSLALQDTFKGSEQAVAFAQKS